MLRLDQRALGSVVLALHETRPLRKVRITGGEPLLRADVPAIVADLRQRLPGAELALTTNGTLLAPVARALRDAGLDAMNISLDTLDEATFARITPSGTLASVLAGIHEALASGFARVKLNCVLMRTTNLAEIFDLVAFAAVRDLEIRFIELMPMGPGAPLFESEFVSGAEALSVLETRYPRLSALPPSGTATRFLLRAGGRDARVGFISPVSHPFCAGCDRLRLDARGRLFTCLRRDEGLDLAALVATAPREVVQDALRSALLAKREPDRFWPARTMSALGG